MRITKSLVALVAALTLWAVPSQAQFACQINVDPLPCSIEHHVSAEVVLTAELEASRVFTNFGIIGVSNYNNPAGKDAAPFNLSVVANAPWSLSVATETPTWEESSKEAEDLRIRIGAGPYLPLSTTGQTLASGPAGISPVMLAQFNSLWDYADDPPGVYEIDVFLTLSTP